MRVTVNRAPVLTLWATVVAERLGFVLDSLRKQTRRRASEFTKGQTIAAQSSGAIRCQCIIRALFAAQPLTQTSGRSSATRRASPACSVASATSSMSL